MDCPNGHSASDSDAFCPTCGVSLSATGRPAHAAPAAWYPDPDDSAQWRYWNGSAWTEDRAPRGPEPARVAAAPVSAGVSSTLTPWVAKSRDRWRGQTRNSRVALGAVGGLAVAAAIAAIALGGGGGDSESSGGPTAGGSGDAFDRFVERTNEEYDYRWSGTTQDAADEFFFGTLQANGYDPSFDPTPELALVYAKAACLSARDGGNPASQLGIEFRDQPRMGADQALTAAYYLCRDENLSRFMGRGG